MENFKETAADLDYRLVLLVYIAEICAESGETEKISELRLRAIRQLYGQLAAFREKEYMESLLSAIARKKADMIMSITSKTEMEKLMNPRPPHFDENKFIPDKYLTPEEELIAWSETSLLTPLKEAGVRRCKELLMQVFPEQVKEIFGGE